MARPAVGGGAAPWGGAAVVIFGVGWYSGVDVRPWFKWAHYPQAVDTTGSVTKPLPVDLEAINKAIACQIKRKSDIDRLIERRKNGWAVYDKCKTDWKPSWSDK